MKKNIFLALTIVISFLSISWFSNYKINIKDVKDFYSIVKLKDAPEILLSKVKDRRKNRSLIGKIGSLKFVTNIPENRAFTDRIGARLKAKGFNVKVKTISENSRKIEKTLMKKNAINFITGDIYKFSFFGIDPETMKTKGKSVFNIRVYDVSGAIVFDEYFFVNVTLNVSETPLDSAEDLVEELFNASIDTLFNDPDFTGCLQMKNNQFKTLKDCAYYDKKLSIKVNTLVDEFNSKQISKKEFIKERKELIRSF